MWTCFQMFQRSTSKIVGQPLTSPFLSGIMVLTAPLGALGALGARTKSAPLLLASVPQATSNTQSVCPPQRFLPTMTMVVGIPTHLWS